MLFYDFRQLNLGIFFTSTFSRGFLRFIGTFGRFLLVSGRGVDVFVECISGTDGGFNIVIDCISGIGGADHVVECVSGRPKTASCSVSELICYYYIGGCTEFAFAHLMH